MTMTAPRIAALVVALTISSSAFAQPATNAVPPPKIWTGEAEGEVGKTNEAIGDAATNLGAIGVVSYELGKDKQRDGNFMASRTGRILGRHELGAGEKVIAQGDRLRAGGNALVKGADKVGKVAKVVSYLDKGYRGDKVGLAQNATEDAVEYVATRLCSPFGPAGVAACSGAYGVGQAVGGGINSLTEMVTGSTLQDHMTDGYFSGYEKIKHALDPMSDPDSAEFEQAMEQRARDNRARHSSSAQQHSNRNQELAEIQRQQAAAAQQQSPDFQSLMGGLSGALGSQAPLAGAQGAAGAPQEDIDPATGCHRGHDEKSHPGGCRDYSRGEPTTAGPTGASVNNALFVGPPAPPKKK